MAMIIVAAVLLAAQAGAHYGVRKIEVDGVVYPAWDVRIDSYLGPVKRVEWSHQNVPTQMGFSKDPNSHEFGPITNIDSPAIACGEKAEAPSIKAIARAGAEINVTWTSIIKMHKGPVLSYMGYLPTPSTSINTVKFFKIQDESYDPRTDTWASDRAASAGNSYTLRIPSDVVPGPYVLRTEMLALHANTASMKMTPVGGPEFYLHCFNIEVLGNGTVAPEGTTFPGTYKATDPGMGFVPYFGEGSGVERNKFFVSPGGKKYEGKYDLPAGPAPVVKETGAYTGELQTKYEAIRDRMQDANSKIIEMVNKAWPANKEFSMSVGLAYMKTQMSTEWKDAWAAYSKVQSEVQGLKDEIQKAQ
ncbi:Rhamnogalacturonate lyase B [Venturia nashicola]|nr:Rhamnogalacturonate lyase B [Venturia nashicola]